MAGSAKLEGPLYTPPQASGSLGAEKVSGPSGAKSPADPLGLNKTSSK